MMTKANDVLHLKNNPTKMVTWLERLAAAVPTSRSMVTVCSHA